MQKGFKEKHIALAVIRMWNRFEDCFLALTNYATYIKTDKNLMTKGVPLCLYNKKNIFIFEFYYFAKKI